MRGGPKHGAEGDNGRELGVITYELRQLSASDKASYVSREIAGGFNKVVIPRQKTRAGIFCYFMSGIDSAQTSNIPHQAAVNTHYSK